MSMRELRVNAVELLRQPGAVKPVDVVVSGPDLDIEHAALAGEITVDLELAALNDGIVVNGRIVVPWSGACRRCLRALAGDSAVDIGELYQLEVTDEDAFPILDNQLDLSPMARQVALLELDEEHLCRDDCAGLCPVCGIDLNADSCECDVTVTDDRWAALDGIVLDD